MKKNAYNPYLPSWEYIPDGEPYVFNGRVYVFGSHDYYNGYVFCMGDYVCWSAPVKDLSDWRYEGIIYPRNADPMNREGKMCLYAPDVTVGPDGRYYLYYVLDQVSVVSVAVCEEPAGRYEFYGYVHYPDGTLLGEKEGDQPQFDPGVLTEGDVTYLYTGFCGQGDKSRSGAMATVLAADMLTVKEAPVFVAPGCEYSKGTGFEGHAFFEAPSIRKIGDTYYFIYSSELMHELCYATSNAPTKGFTYRGVLVSNSDLHIGQDKPAEMPMAYGANNHGSIVEIDGEWYIFYHRHTNGTWYSRQACAEKLLRSSDGGFAQVELTSCGLNGGPLPGKGEYPAYIACRLFTDTPSVYVGGDSFPKIMQDGRDGDEEPGYIANMMDSATAGFKYFDLHGVTAIRITVRGYASGFFEVRTAWDGEVLAKIPTKNSNVWETYETEVVMPEGVQALYLTYRGSGKASLLSFELVPDRQYRNIFSEIGISQKEIDRKLEEIVQTFFYDEEERIYHAVGNDMGYLEDTGNHDVRTEGMSYGMMMCVQLDMKEEFDCIWKWAKTYMWMDSGENEGYFAWSCAVDGTKNSYGPAPDGEEYFAMALFFASARWGDGEGIFDYSTEAKEILRACLHKGENGRAGAPMWNRENHQILFVPGSPFTDPSYHLPHFYELFAERAYEEDRGFWKKAADASRKYLAKACHENTGMSAEYAHFDGTPVYEEFEWGQHGYFYSDAYRTIANIGLDYSWNGIDEGQCIAVERLQYCLGVTNKDNPYMTYKIDGTVLDQPALHPIGLLATVAQGSLAIPERLDGDNLSAQGKLAKEWVERFWKEPLRRGDRRYYDNCLYLFAILALSGKYRIW